MFLQPTILSVERVYQDLLAYLWPGGPNGPVFFKHTCINCDLSCACLVPGATGESPKEGDDERELLSLGDCTDADAFAQGFEVRLPFPVGCNNSRYCSPAPSCPQQRLPRPEC